MRSSKMLFASALALGASGCATSAPHRQAALEVRPVATSALPTQRGDELYRDAVAAIHRRDYASALDILQVARSRKPDDPRILNAFGVVYDELGRFDLSARYYAQAQAADPNSKIVAQNLAYSAVLQSAAGSVALAAEAHPAAAAATKPAAQLALATPPTPTITPAAEPLGPPQVAASPAARRAAIAVSHVRLAPAARFAEATPVQASAVSPAAELLGPPQVAAAPEVRRAQAWAPQARLVPTADWPQFAALEADRAPAIEIHPVASVHPTTVAAAPAAVIGRSLAQPAWPRLAAADAAPSGGAASEHAYVLDHGWSNTPLLIAAAPEAKPADLLHASYVMQGPMLLPQSLGDSAEPAPAQAPAADAAGTARDALASADQTPASRTSLAAAPRAHRGPARRPFHFVVAALSELAHVLHLPFGHQLDSGVLLAKSQPAGAAKASPAISRPAAWVSATEAHLQPASWSGPASRSAPVASTELARAAATVASPIGPALLGRPITLVAADRKAGEALRRELVRQGWTVAVSTERTRAPRESVIRFQPAHQRVALALAHSLRIPAKLQSCRLGCSGVSLVIGADAFARRADASRAPRPLS